MGNRSTILALTLGSFAVVMSATTINVAIAPIMQALDLSPRQAQLLSSTFLGTTVILAPVSAWVANRWDGVRVFIALLSIYALISGLCVPYADNFALLICVRIIQGCCAGLVQPLAMFLLLELTPKSHHGRSMSLFGFGVVMAPAIGPAFAGWLVEHAGWQYVLGLGTPPALMAIILLRLTRIKKVKRPVEKNIRKLDMTGILLLTMLVSIFFIWPLIWQIGIWSAIIVASVWIWLAYSFWKLQSKTNSMLPVELLPLSNFKRLALISIAYGTGMYGSIYLLPLWLQGGLSVSADTTGGILLVGGVALALSIILAGRLVDRFTAKPVLIFGMVCFALSCFLLSLVDGLMWIALGIVLGRIGLGTIIPSLYPLVAQAVDEADLRRAMAFTILLRQSGGVIGVVGIGLLVSLLQAIPILELGQTQIYEGLFLMFALIFVFSVFMAHQLGR